MVIKAVKVSIHIGSGLDAVGHLIMLTTLRGCPELLGELLRVGCTKEKGFGQNENAHLQITKVDKQ